jgi:hypothetical protein
MSADRNVSESGRKQLMSDPTATVMTSPQTGQLVDNASDAVAPAATAVPVPVIAQSAPQPSPATPATTPQTAKEEGGFNNWLHHLFPSDDQGNTVRAKTVVREVPPENSASPAIASGTLSATPPHDLMADTAAPVVASVQPSAPPAVDALPASSEVIHLVPPAPQPAAAPDNSAQAALPLTVAPSPPVAADASVQQPASAEMEPVHLHPPTSMAADADAMPATNAASEGTIALVPPSTSSQTHYLADSRYAARRMQAPSADDSNNN